MEKNDWEDMLPELVDRLKTKTKRGKVRILKNFINKVILEEA